ncbi:MAG: ABC transporter permease [Saprospiraceae bacterium]|nr:ABC transporter permease [Saprospiraceae bacterium]
MKINFIQHLGRFLIWMRLVFSKPENLTMYWRETMRQMNDIGIGSLIIVVLISTFMGAVMAVQISYQLGGQLIPRYYVGYLVRDITIIELAPTITCLVLAGKVGSNMAAEIGGMRQKEHIDAMEIMGVNTSAFLVMPKIIAAILVVPLLVSVAAFVSILGAFAAAVPTGLFTTAEYIEGIRSFLEPWNIFIMYVKAVVFGLLLASISCYQGYFVKGGSIELGKASTAAVVMSNIAILIADYLIAVLLTS